jgi:hypothetical protein
MMERFIRGSCLFKMILNEEILDEN